MSPPASAWHEHAGPSPPPSPPPRPPPPKFAIVDAFTSSAFGGNAAAVVMLAPFTPFPSDEFCQSLAAEFNQSETAVVVRRADGPGYALRWFSPTTEVDLCGAFAPPFGARCAPCAPCELTSACAGHATLAAAHALVSEQAAQLPLSFHTRSGELKVARDAKTSTLLELDFPAGAPSAPPAAAVAPLAAALAAALAPGAEAALQADIQWLGRAEAVGDLVVLLSSEAAVRSLAPNFEKLAQLGGRGVVVTAPSPSPAADYGACCRCVRAPYPRR